MAQLPIRPPAVAGTWYPAQPETLARSIDGLLAQQPAAGLPGALRGLLVPHAALRYSGRVAAAAFRQLQGGSWDLLVLLGPNHRSPARGQVLAVQAAAYSTPLGVLPVELDLLHALAQNVPVHWLSDDNEHALEIQLPFLQRSLAPVPPLLPLMLGWPDLNFAARLAGTLARLLVQRQALLLISSDWSHYYADPVARELDRRGIELLLQLDADGLAAALERGQTEACGAAALLSGLLLARAWGLDQTRELAYATSGDINGDRSRVVGYAAVALLAGRQASQKPGASAGAAAWATRCTKGEAAGSSPQAARTSRQAL